MSRQSHAILALAAFGAMAMATWAEGTRPPRLPRPDVRAPLTALHPIAGAGRGGEVHHLAAAHLR
ncbi:hypothetical protein [Sphingomonas sp.]|uniref:hypothetical protein n=1 Tax=Sphingomonas sp. TaxID=28214 RepID=UPI001B2ED411|nr:hypothetical protein [Sphingomonas sp.]MBO9714212.1 hypothetical protein [Sphingomonas sp.]